VLTLIACNSDSSVATPVSEQQKPSVDPAPSPVAPIVSPWTVSVSNNELTGERTVKAIAGICRRCDQTIVIRLTGKKLECYLDTGKFLETVDNMESNLSVVKYKFDDGPIVRQSWSMSSDHEALFYPGNPSAFLQKMRKAKRFIIEYKPADVIPETASFDFPPFPTEFAQVLDAAVSKANTTAKALMIRLCKPEERSEERPWCWTDPDGYVRAFATKEEAISVIRGVK